MILLKTMKRFGWFASAFVVVLSTLWAGCGEDEQDGSQVVSDAQAGTAGVGPGGIGGTGGSGDGMAGAGGAISLDSAGGAAGSSDGSSCGDFGNNAACKTCLKEKCCGQTATCGANAECTALIECANACPNPSDGSSECVRTCAMNHQDGISHFNGALLCLGRDCSDVCSHL